MADIDVKIVRHIGAYNQDNVYGFRGELNIVSWNKSKPKFDIREWNKDHTRMTKGLTFTYEEMCDLKKLIDTYFELDPEIQKKAFDEV